MALIRYSVGSHAGSQIVCMLYVNRSLHHTLYSPNVAKSWQNDVFPSIPIIKSVICFCLNDTNIFCILYIM